jgi:LVIVD repeat-containing protein
VGDRHPRSITRDTGGRRLWRLVPILIIVGSNLLVMSASGALPGPLNDLLALGQGGGQTPEKVTIQRNAEPPLVATPQAKCATGSREEPGVQGRVPAGSAVNGLNCNATLVSHQGTSGGFKAFRYVDTLGHACAFYDTALLFPINALKLDSSSLGVAVLDMSDPSHPVQTDTLTQPPMMSPHESLSLNPKRGLLAAVLGNPTTYPGLVSIYDVSKDCRHPALQSTALVARFGHESGFAPDGKTFYATGTAVQAITAIDVTDPKNPHAIWHGNVVSHGMSLSNDGNRAYIADPNGNMLILDVSEIQARKPDPQAREISRLTWTAASIPQNAIPFTRGGRPYVLEFDEYTAGTTGNGDPDAVGAARIIDISDETRPRIVSYLRLQVNQPADHAAAADDPGAQSPVQGYAAHYCNIPTRLDPKVVACSFIASGLRVFDISKLTAPKEIAYFVAPTKAVFENGFDGSNFAMSQPAFAPQQREIWYTDGTSGFYDVRVNKAVWP